MGIKVKYCGITNFSDAIYASKIGVDALGFIFTESKRKVMPDKAKAIIEKLPPFVSTVGVFMNDPIEKVLNIAKSTKIDFIQLFLLYNAKSSLSVQRVFDEGMSVKAFAVKSPEYIAFLYIARIDGNVELFALYQMLVYIFQAGAANLDEFMKSDFRHGRPLV